MPSFIRQHNFLLECLKFVWILNKTNHIHTLNKCDDLKIKIIIIIISSQCVDVFVLCSHLCCINGALVVCCYASIFLRIMEARKVDLSTQLLLIYISQTLLESFKDEHWNSEYIGICIALKQHTSIWVWV